jgi:molybdenum cofactor cytidylyltransferase
MGLSKALLRISETTFLQRIIETHQSLGLPVSVVLGDDSSLIRAKIDLSSVSVLLNPNPSQGPLSSLRIALDHNSDSEALVLHPVDHPLVTPDTVTRLIGRYREVPHCIIIPQYHGRRGHPVLFPARYYPDLRRAPLAEGARSVVRSNRAANHLLEVPDCNILLNIDTPQQYQELVNYRRLDRP